MSIWTDALNNVKLGRMSSADELQAWMISVLSNVCLRTGKTLFERHTQGYLKEGKNLHDFTDLFTKREGTFKVFDEIANDLFVNQSEENPYIFTIYGNVVDKNKFSFKFTTTNCEDMEKFAKVGMEYFEDKTDNSVHMLTCQNGSYGFTKIGSLDYPLLRENYDEKVVSGFDYMVKHLTGKNPPGKLAILSGPAGTGKTFFIKGLIDAVSKDSMCVVLPAQLITELDGPGLVPVLLDQKYSNRYSYDFDEPVDMGQPSKEKPIVFIAEDCDHYLVPREGANSSLISGLLNYTDGIMSDLLNIRFIATTNAPHLQIDPALKRPGRLLKHCLVDELCVEQANKIYSRLTEGKGTDWFNESTSLASIYARASGAELYDEEILEGKEKRMGFGS